MVKKVSVFIITGYFGEGWGSLRSVSYITPVKIQSFAATLARMLLSTYLERRGVIFIICYYFQVWQDLVFLCLIPCHLLTVISTNFVTMPVETISLTGCRVLLLYQ